MAEKRFYWFKFKEDYFNSDGIRYLEDMEDGYAYIVFYQKLCIDSLNTEGKLIRQLNGRLLPHDERSLRRIVNMDIDYDKALSSLIEAGLIEILEDGTIYIVDLPDLIKSESKWAEKKRKQREGDKVRTMSPKSEDNVPLNRGQCPVDIEIDKDKDIEREIDIEVTSQCDTLPPKTHYGEYGNVLLSSEEHTKLLEEYGEHETKLCVKLLDEKIEMKGYKSNSHYLTIKDWVIVEVKERIKDGRYPKRVKTEEEKEEDFKRFQELLNLDRLLEEEEEV